MKRIHVPSASLTIQNYQKHSEIQTLLLKASTIDKLNIPAQFPRPPVLSKQINAEKNPRSRCLKGAIFLAASILQQRRRGGLSNHFNVTKTRYRRNVNKKRINHPPTVNRPTNRLRRQSIMTI